MLVVLGDSYRDQRDLVLLEAVDNAQARPGGQVVATRTLSIRERVGPGGSPAHQTACRAYASARHHNDQISPAVRAYPAGRPTTADWRNSPSSATADARPGPASPPTPRKPRPCPRSGWPAR